MRAQLCVTSSFVAIALAGTASAQPAAKPGATACLPAGRSVTLSVQGKAAIACTDAKACIQIEMSGDAKSVAAPAESKPTPVWTVKRDGGTTSVCAGTCTKVGKRVGFEILAAERDALDAETSGRAAQLAVEMTADRKIVVVAGRAFTVATDKELALTPPKEWKTLPAKPVSNPKLLRVDAAGAVLVATWADAMSHDRCDGAGGCHAVTVDTAGAIKSGSWFSPGRVIAMDADRAVVVGTDPTEITTVTRKGVVWNAHLSDGNIGPVAARVDGDTLVVVTTSGGYDVRWLKILADKPAETLAKKTIASCGRP